MPIYRISLILAVQACQDSTSVSRGVLKAPAWISGAFRDARGAWGHRGATEKIRWVPLRRGHANLLCIVPILVYVLPKQAQTEGPEESQIYHGLPAMLLIHGKCINPLFCSLASI